MTSGKLIWITKSLRDRPPCFFRPSITRCYSGLRSRILMPCRLRFRVVGPSRTSIPVSSHFLINLIIKGQGFQNRCDLENLRGQSLHKLEGIWITLKVEYFWIMSRIWEVVHMQSIPPWIWVIWIYWTIPKQSATSCYRKLQQTNNKSSILLTINHLVIAKSSFLPPARAAFKILYKTPKSWQQCLQNLWKFGLLAIRDSSQFPGVWMSTKR